MSIDIAQLQVLALTQAQGLEMAQLQVLALTQAQGLEMSQLQVLALGDSSLAPYTPSTATRRYQTIVVN